MSWSTPYGSSPVRTEMRSGQHSSPTEEWVEALELSEKAAGGPLVASIRNRILSPVAFA